MLISQEMLLDVLPRWDAVVRSMNANVAAMQDFGSAVDMFACKLSDRSARCSGGWLHNCHTPLHIRGGG